MSADEQAVCITFGISGVVLMLVAIPLLRRTVKPNLLYGLRIRSTLKDPKAWYLANRVMARDLLAVGALLVGTCIAFYFGLVSGRTMFVAGILLLLFGTVGAGLHGSYAVRKKEG